MIRLLLATVLALSAPLPTPADCGPYPFEGSTLCPTGTAVFVCRYEDGLEHWVFVGCWEQ